MNGNVCFVDTSAFIALNVPQDKNHREALQIAKQLNGMMKALFPFPGQCLFCEKQLTVPYD